MIPGVVPSRFIPAPIAGPVPEIVIRKEARDLTVERYMREWREEENAKAPPLVNVSFVHNPNWRGESVMSITAARTTNHPLWVITRVLFFASQLILAWAFGYGLGR